jgi:hypothetical protein
MTSNGPPRYRVEPVPVAERQIAKLLQRAAQLGTMAEVIGTLRGIIRKLESQPGTWGDPQYHTHLPGGVVLRGFLKPLVVKYALFEKDRAVLLLEVWALPGHPLALD